MTTVRTLISSIVLFTLACDGGREVAAPVASHPDATGLRFTTSTMSSTKRTEAARLARGLAVAMKSPALRTHLRHAMRDSRLTDHKLVLQDFARDPKGNALVLELATALGSAPDDVRGLIRELPTMDVYVPFRAHRLAWKGSPDVLVAVSFEPDAPTLDAYNSDGKVETLRLADGLPKRTLLLIHPAEPTSVESRGPSFGESIEATVERSGASRMEVCEGPDCSESGGGYTPLPAGVYVTQFYSYRGDGWWGSLEMEFRSFAWEGRFDYLGNGFWYADKSCSKGTGTATLEPERNYTGLTILASPGVTNLGVACDRTYFPTGYAMQAFESDGGLNGNGDDFGRRYFTGGTIPAGAQMGQQLLYYSHGGTPSDGELSVSMTLQFR